MRHMKFTSSLFILASIIALSGIKAQAQDSAWHKAIDSSSIIVHRDARLDLLIRKQAQINEETTRDSRKNMKGFRILVVNTNKRDEAIAAKTKIYKYFPELKAYLIYQSPYFRLKVGNFKERKDAEDYEKKLNTYFPKGVFIMNDVIEVKPGKPGEDETVRR